MTGQNDWNKQQEWLLKICDALKEMHTKYEGGEKRQWSSGSYLRA